MYSRRKRKCGDHLWLSPARERGHVLHFGSQPEVLALVSHVIASEALAAGHAVLRTWTPTALDSVCVQNRMSGLSQSVLVEAAFKDTR